MSLILSSYRPGFLFPFLSHSILIFFCTTTGCHWWRKVPRNFQHVVWHHFEETGIDVQHKGHSFTVYRFVFSVSKVHMHSLKQAVVFFDALVAPTYRSSVATGDTKFLHNLQTYLLSRDHSNLKSEFQDGNGKVWLSYSLQSLFLFWWFGESMHVNLSPDVAENRRLNWTATCSGSGSRWACISHCRGLLPCYKIWLI